MEHESKNELQNSIPKDVLYYLFRFLTDRKTFLNAKRVNRTWYHLLMNNEEIMKDFIKDYINKRMKQYIPHFAASLNADDINGMIAIAQQINFRTRHPNLQRTQIMIRNQLRLNTLWECFKQTARTLRNRYYPPVLGNPTRAEVARDLIVVYLICAISLYLFRAFAFEEKDTSFIQALKDVPFLFLKGFYHRYARALQLTFGVVFLMEFYKNFRHSNTAFQQTLIQDVAQSPPGQQIIAKNKIRVPTPTEYMTICWKREDIFSSQSQKDPESEDSADLISKKNV